MDSVCLSNLLIDYWVGCFRCSTYGRATIYHVSGFNTSNNIQDCEDCLRHCCVEDCYWWKLSTLICLVCILLIHERLSDIVLLSHSIVLLVPAIHEYCLRLWTLRHVWWLCSGQVVGWLYYYSWYLVHVYMHVQCSIIKYCSWYEDLYELSWYWATPSYCK